MAQTWEYIVMILVFGFLYIGGGYAFNARYAKKRAPGLLCLLYGGSQGRLAFPVVVFQATGIGHAAHTLASQWLTGVQDRRYAWVTAGAILSATLLYWGIWRSKNRRWLGE